MGNRVANQINAKVHIHGSSDSFHCASPPMDTLLHHTNSRSIKLVSNNCKVIHSQLIHVNFDFANGLCCVCVDKNPGKLLG